MAPGPDQAATAPSDDPASAPTAAEKTRIHGPDHHSVALSKTGVAKVLLDRRQLKTAAAAIAEVQRIYSHVDNPSVDDVADAWFVSAKIEAQRGQMALARAQAERALVLLLAQPHRWDNERREVADWLAERESGVVRPGAGRSAGGRDG